MDHKKAAVSELERVQRILDSPDLIGDEPQVRKSLVSARVHALLHIGDALTLLTQSQQTPLGTGTVWRQARNAVLAVLTRRDVVMAHTGPARLDRCAARLTSLLATNDADDLVDVVEDILTQSLVSWSDVSRRELAEEIVAAMTFGGAQ